MFAFPNGAMHNDKALMEALKKRPIEVFFTEPRALLMREGSAAAKEKMRERGKTMLRVGADGVSHIRQKVKNARSPRSPRTASTGAFPDNR